MSAALAPSPLTVIVSRIPDSAYQLRRQLFLEIETDNGGYIIVDPATGVFHRGQDFMSALAGFLRVFVSEFEFLRSHEDQLSAHLSAELDRFNEVITTPVPTPA